MTTGAKRAAQLGAEAAFQVSPDPCFVITAEPQDRFRVRAVNTAFEQSTGLTAQTVVGRDPRDFLAEPVASTIAQRLLACVREGRSISYQDEMSLPVGTRTWWVRAVPVADERGAVEVVLGFAHDVTDQLRAEAEVKASEARLRQLIEVLHEGIWRIDATATTTFVNPRMAQMLGYQVHEMVGRRVFDFLDEPTTKQAQRNLERESRGQRAVHVQELRRKDGTWLTASIAVAPLFNDHGEFLGSVAGVQDLTETRLAEQHRRDLEKKLQETQKLESLGLLAGGIAHDFNNILTTILSSASLARMEDHLPTPLDGYLEHIESASEHAAELCKQMLAYAGKAKFSVQSVDLNRVVRETTELIRVSLDKRVALAFELESLPLVVNADTTELGQVLMNLVINASEAITGTQDWSRPGVVTLKTSVVTLDERQATLFQSPQPLSPGQYACLQVSDNGPGMSREACAKVFDPFYTTKFAGRGLGLSAVLGIVRGHAGAITVESEVSRGATFTLLLPLGDGAEEVRPKPATPTSFEAGEGTVLVVDDEPRVLKSSSAILQKLGFEVLTATNGIEAIQTLNEHSDAVTLVLMDLTMPQMDGAAAFRKLRASHPQLRIVLMSGYDEQDAISRFEGERLTGFLQKPFSAQGLARKLRDVLG